MTIAELKDLLQKAENVLGPDSVVYWEEQPGILRLADAWKITREGLVLFDDDEVDQ